ncbi:MAG TPA: metalloregulator ArsR/SmtB family transcription factor [Alphaproteobacteria bacterium]|nr:metalloregulator ArsR/SmtB family transcription factor [Alphaproteobacteria bacterium]
MVEYKIDLDAVFGALSDKTRRDILERVAKKEKSIGELAKHYNLTFAAISKHIISLEKANLVTKTRKGKQQFIKLSPKAFLKAEDYLQYYKRIWNERLDSLELYLAEEKNGKKNRNRKNI